MNSKIKIAGLGVLAALAVAASPFVIKIGMEKDAVAAPEGASSQVFSAAQKAELDGIIKDYIMKNPKVLMDSVNGYKTEEQQNDEKAANETLKENQKFFFNGSLPEVGNKKADVTVVEFFDYNCGYCKQGFESVQQGIADDKNLRFVFVDFPILSDTSTTAAKYALAAQKQGKYFELHKALMEFKGPKTEDNILNLAKGVGLDTDKLKKDSVDPSIDDALKTHQELAAKMAITGTPAFIVNGQIIRGFIPYPAMKTMIADQRKKQG